MSILDKYNQKRVRSVLIIAVALLWIIIVFKVISMFRGPSNAVVTPFAGHKSEKPYEVLTDTFTLNLEYKDPFRSTLYFGTHSTAKKSTSVVQKKVAKPIKIKASNCITEVFLYKGAIKTNGSNKNTVLLKHRSSSYFLTEKEFIGDFQLYKVYNDSVVIRKDDCFKTYYRN